MAQIPLSGSVGVPGSAAILGSYNVIFTSNAPHALTATEWSNRFLNVTSSSALAGPQQLVAPLIQGIEFVVQNNTTGGQAIQVAGSSGEGVIVANGETLLVSCDGANYLIPTGAVSLAGDVTGSSGANTVAKIQGVAVSSTPPTNGQVLEYQSGSASYVPVTFSGSGVTWSGDLAGSGDSAQYVSSLSGPAGDLATVAFNAKTLQIAANQTDPTILQAGVASTSTGAGAAGTALTIASQPGQSSTHSGSNGGSGGALILQSGNGGSPGAGATAGANGNILVTDGYFENFLSVLPEYGQVNVVGVDTVNLVTGSANQNVVELTELLDVGVGTSFTRKTITAATYTVDSGSTTDFYLMVNRAGAVTITLPLPTDGRTLIIKDISGAAGTNHITITPTAADIDGAGSYVINTNYGYVALAADSTLNWFITTVTPGSSFTAAGDLSGSNTSQTVIGLQTHPVASQTLSSGQDGYVLFWNGSTWEGTWLPATQLVGGSMQLANVTAIGAVQASQLVLGMLAYDQANTITYQLTSLTPGGGFANGTWTPVVVPSGGVWSPGAATVATSNITLSGEQTINGVTTSGSRVLVVGQTTASQNGLYTSASGAWSYTSDGNVASDYVVGKTISIVGGTYSGAIYVCTIAPATLGTNTCAFAANGSASTVVGGDLSGSTLAATVAQITGPSSATLPILAASSTWTPAGISNLIISETPYEVQTTNATATTIATIATTSGYIYRVDALVITLQSADGYSDALSNTHAGMFSNVSGTLSQLGSTLNGSALGTTGGLTWTGLTMAVSSTNILVKVTGAASTTINWRVQIRLTVTT